MRKITTIDAVTNQAINPRLKVAAYVRVSSTHEDQLISLAAQKKHYKSFIENNSNWDLVDIYSDEGITGTKKDKRLALLRMIADCEKGEIDFIVTKSISRFARNTIDCLELVRKLIGLGVHIHFEKENINTESMDSELMLSILSSLAENESMSISENSKWAIRKRFENGTYKLSYPPYGFDYIDGEIVVNETQAIIVKRIFESVLNGMGTEKIAKQLNEEGIPSKRNGNWTGSTVRGMIKNEKYTGDVLLQKTYTDENFIRQVNKGELNQFLIENHHEVIISQEDYRAANQMIDYQARKKGITKESKKYFNRYPFSGKIQCAECGDTFKRRIHTSTHMRYIAWGCSTHISKRHECSMLYVREFHIHQAFITMMNKLIHSHEVVLKPLLKCLKNMSFDSNYEQLQEIESKKEKNEEQFETLVNLMTKGILDPALFKEQKNELQHEAIALKEERETLYRHINGEMDNVAELKKAINLVKKATEINIFEEEPFLEIVEKIIMYTPIEIGFQLKCGIILKERMER